jgi:methylenetetrahydrofolate dehydrogenase (NADP+) / methenyltetrahydrofolate cyclohydrolase
VKFDGKKEAEKIADFLEDSEKVLGKSLVIFQCNGKSEMSQYVKLKTEMGERLGVIVTVDFRSQISDLRLGIEEANEDDTVDGILVQLPILDNGSQISDIRRDEILQMIKPSKDIDGLNVNSKFLPAVVRAVERVIDIFRIEDDQSIALVGAKGMVGKRVGERLKVLGLPYEGFDKGDDLNKLKNYEVVISAVGKDGLITEEMVKNGFIGIDLGYPKGDFSVEAVNMASLITPVPGGVGPLTIVGLYENLAEI